MYKALYPNPTPRMSRLRVQLRVIGIGFRDLLSGVSEPLHERQADAGPFDAYLCVDITHILYEIQV